MKKTFLTVLLLCLTLGVSGQQKFREWTYSEALSSKSYTLYEGVYREPWPMFMPWHLDKLKKLDKGRLKIQYDAEVIIDTLGGRQYARDRVAVLAGEQIIHSYGYCFWLHSMENTVPETEIHKYRPLKGYKDIINWFVYRDLRGKRIENYHALPLMTDFAILYEEEQPAFRWAIQDDMDIILGYTCQKAETVYAGREWTVWFTPEIPIDCGLWKFSGLPGLILKAQDSEGFYSFTCVGVEKTEDEITRPAGIKVQRLKREAFRRVEREHYLSPIQNSDRKNGYLIGSHLGDYENNETARMLFTADNYTHPYFPIERR